MKDYYYDLHIHSCLSPCADDDMTPNNIAGMGNVAGLDIMALTDHNSVLNCPAFFSAARKNNIIPIAGMELTTSEEIHIICLFPSCESALEFGREINGKRTLIKNRPDVFGNQLIMDSSDEVTGVEENYLTNAVSISVDEVPQTVAKYGGICYPAHIDREANGIIAVLGTFPSAPVFTAAEFRDEENIPAYREKYALLKDLNAVISSDAHTLWQINGKDHSAALDGETEEEIVKNLFEKLKNR